MPLSADQELREHELRMDQMALNIEKMRADMAAAQQVREDTRKWEDRKFYVSLAVGFAASLGAGVALANYVNGHASVAPPAPPQVIYLVPGQAPAR